MKLVQGKIFHELDAGRRGISCNCIGEPYSSEIVDAHNAEIERLRAAMQRAADMLPANAACGVLRAALRVHQQ